MTIFRGTPYFPPMADDRVLEILKQEDEVLNRIQKETFVPSLVERLEAAGHDERLSTGALYLEAAAALRALLAKHGR